MTTTSDTTVNAELIAFPQARAVGRARHIASCWLRQPSDRARESYWRAAAGGVEKTMRRAGFDDHEIGHQLEQLARHVEREIAAIRDRQQRAAKGGEQMEPFGRGPGAA